MKKVTTNQKPQKRVLVLGAGYVSAPLVEYLCRDENIQVTVGECLRIRVSEIFRRITLNQGST